MDQRKEVGGPPAFPHLGRPVARAFRGGRSEPLMTGLCSDKNCASTERLMARVPQPYSAMQNIVSVSIVLVGLALALLGAWLFLGTAERSGSRRWSALRVRLGVDRLRPTANRDRPIAKRASDNGPSRVDGADLDGSRHRATDQSLNLSRRESFLSDALGILDLLYVFVCEIKKALSRTLISDLAGEPSALLHLRKQLEL